MPKGKGKGSQLRLITDEGWTAYGKATRSKNFERKFKKHRKAALQKVGMLIAQKAIQASKFEKNAALTQMIKGKNTPFRDTGSRVSQAMTAQLVNDKTMFVGVKRSHKMYPAAVAVHDGEVLKVTSSMRQMFLMLWLVSEGGEDPSKLTGRAAELYARNPSGWKPLGDSTKVITLPARKFVEQAFNDSGVRQFALEQYKIAVDRALKDTVKAAGGKPPRGRRS